MNAFYTEISQSSTRLGAVAASCPKRFTCIVTADCTLYLQREFSYTQLQCNTSIKREKESSLPFNLVQTAEIVCCKIIPPV